MKHFVFLGDSITDCEHSFDPDNLGSGYVRMIYEALHNSQISCRVTNKGFDGFTLSALKRLWKRDGHTFHMDYLTILIGINDVGVIHNTGLDPEFALAEFKNSYRRLLEDIRQIYKGPIILMEPFLFPCPERYQLRFDTVKKMNTMICSLASEYKLTFIPLWNTLLTEANIHGYHALTTDGIHLTQYGHQILAQNWLSHLAQIKADQN